MKNKKILKNEYIDDLILKNQLILNNQTNNAKKVLIDLCLQINTLEKLFHNHYDLLEN